MKSAAEETQKLMKLCMFFVKSSKKKMKIKESGESPVWFFGAKNLFPEEASVRFAPYFPTLIALFGPYQNGHQPPS